MSRSRRPPGTMVVIESRLWHQHRQQPHRATSAAPASSAGTRGRSIAHPGELVPVARSRQSGGTPPTALFVLLGYQAGRASAWSTASRLPDAEGRMDIEAKKRQLLDDGCCVVPDVLTAAETEQVRARLQGRPRRASGWGVLTRQIGLDPNEHNVRVFLSAGARRDLRELDPASDRDRVRDGAAGPRLPDLQLHRQHRAPGQQVDGAAFRPGHRRARSRGLHPWSINIICA